MGKGQGKEGVLGFFFSFPFQSLPSRRYGFQVSLYSFLSISLHYEPFSFIHSFVHSWFLILVLFLHLMTTKMDSWGEVEYFRNVQMYIRFQTPPYFTFPFTLSMCLRCSPVLLGKPQQSQHEQSPTRTPCFLLEIRVTAMAYYPTSQSRPRIGRRYVLSTICTWTKRACRVGERFPP